MLNDPIIYLAITHGKNRLVISGSFDLYCKFIQASLPKMQATPGLTIFNPAPETSTENSSNKKG